MINTIQEMINTLQELQQMIDQAPADPSGGIDALLTELQCHIDPKVEDLKLSVQMVGQPEDVRVQAAAELVLELWHDCSGFAAMSGYDLIGEALGVICPDLLDRSQRARLRQKIEPVAQQLIADAKEQRQLVFDLSHAQAMAQRDRELLGLPAGGELTEDQIAEARKAAEVKAGTAKNGRPFPRFKNAQERLLLVMANEPE